jgi:hypothetical protein
MFELLVQPVLCYGAVVWGTSSYSEVQSVHNMNCRLCMFGCYQIHIKHFLCVVIWDGTAIILFFFNRFHSTSISQYPFPHGYIRLLLVVSCFLPVTPDCYPSSSVSWTTRIRLCATGSKSHTKHASEAMDPMTWNACAHVPVTSRTRPTIQGFRLYQEYMTGE